MCRPWSKSFAFNNSSNSYLSDPGNAHFISGRQVASDTATLRRYAATAASAAASLLLLLLYSQFGD